MQPEQNIDTNSFSTRSWSREWEPVSNQIQRNQSRVSEHGN
jgi:hypothetical protein